MTGNFLKSVTPLFILFLSAAFITMDKWNADEKKYKITFSTEEAEGSIHGLTLDFNFNENMLSSSSIRASVDVSTLNTGDATKNKHALSEEWLNAKSFPNMTFESTEIVKGNNGYLAKGKLTVRGVTQQVDFVFSFSSKKNKGRIKGNFSINRFDFGINGEGIGDVIKILVDISVLK